MTITIKIGDKEFGLTFGMIAVEEMQLRTLSSLNTGVMALGNAKALTDMFYCSHNNYNDINGVPRITYGNAIEIVEELVYSDDVETQNYIVETFKNCRATKALMQKFEQSGGEEDKKKA